MTWKPRSAPATSLLIALCARLSVTECDLSQVSTGNNSHFWSILCSRAYFKSISHITSIDPHKPLTSVFYYLHFTDEDTGPGNAYICSGHTASQ